MTRDDLCTKLGLNTSHHLPTRNQVQQPLGSFKQWVLHSKPEIRSNEPAQTAPSAKARSAKDRNTLPPPMKVPQERPFFLSILKCDAFASQTAMMLPLSSIVCFFFSSEGFSPRVISEVVSAKSRPGHHEATEAHHQRSGRPEGRGPAGAPRARCQRWFELLEGTSVRSRLEGRLLGQTGRSFAWLAVAFSSEERRKDLQYAILGPNV